MSLALPEAVPFPGIDWAAEAHAVCVMDAAGKVVARFTVGHSADRLGRLTGLGDLRNIPVTIERPSGRLVDVLLEAGHPIVPVSPNAIKTWRDGEVLSGAKSDARDAEVIAKYLLTAAVRGAVLALVSALKAVTAVVKDLDRSPAAHLGEHPDGKIFTSLPRPGQINAAQMLAEWGDYRQACDGPASVAALAGCTPVTRASGKHHAVHFRWAYNKRFRKAITTFADNSRHASRWAARIYADARASGKDPPHAVRILARAWIRVIKACWLNGIPYNPGKHGAAAALMEQTAGRSAA